MELSPCPSCGRHVRFVEPSCPFCGSLATRPEPQRGRITMPRGQVTRAAIVLLGAVGASACDDGGSADIYGAAPMPPDEPSPALVPHVTPEDSDPEPIYGGPPMDDEPRPPSDVDQPMAVEAYGAPAPPPEEPAPPPEEDVTPIEPEEVPTE